MIDLKQKNPNNSKKQKTPNLLKILITYRVETGGGWQENGLQGFSSLGEEQRLTVLRAVEQEWGKNYWWTSTLEQGCAGSVKLKAELKGSLERRLGTGQ